MLALILALTASVATGAAAGLYILEIWWRFALSLALTVGLWAATLAQLLGN
jgi:hypothetical protein